MLADPYSFPTDAALGRLGPRGAGRAGAGRALERAHVGGRGGAVPRTRRSSSGGAVGVSLAGVEMLPCVSQGAAPLGREVTITAAEGNVIHELAGRPALETIEQHHRRADAPASGR